MFYPARIKFYAFFFKIITLSLGVTYLSKSHFIDVDKNQNLLINCPWVVLVYPRDSPHPHLEFSSTNKEDVGANARDLRSDSDHCHGAEAEGEGCPIEVGFTFLLSGSLPQLRAGLTVREEAQFTSLLW